MKEDNTHMRLRRRLLAILPLSIVGLGGYSFWKMLNGLQDGSFNPHSITLPIINHPVPNFPLSGAQSPRPFSLEELRHPPRTILLNFFASWCIPCVQEASALIPLSTHLQIYGIAYKDKPTNTQQFLKHSGDPYSKLIYDQNGRIGIEWGVSGVPESFLIDRHGVIRWHSAAPIEESDIPAIVNLTQQLNMS